MDYAEWLAATYGGPGAVAPRSAAQPPPPAVRPPLPRLEPQPAPQPERRSTVVHKTCEQCGEPFESERSDTRFCGAACRARSWREESRPPAGAVVTVAGSVRRAVEQTLDGAGLGGSWEASAALDLADAIDGGGQSGSARAALHRELRAVMGEALRGVDEPGSQVGALRDEVAERRARRAGGGGGVG